MIESIYHDICAGRESISMVAKTPAIGMMGQIEIDQPTATPKPDDKTYHHYKIWGEGETEQKACSDFWENFKRAGPLSDGRVLWRCVPKMEKLRDFEKNIDVYRIATRFAIEEKS